MKIHLQITDGFGGDGYWRFYAHTTITDRNGQDLRIGWNHTVPPHLAQGVSPRFRTLLYLARTAKRYFRRKEREELEAYAHVVGRRVREEYVQTLNGFRFVDTSAAHGWREATNPDRPLTVDSLRRVRRLMESPDASYADPEPFSYTDPAAGTTVTRKKKVVVVKRRNRDLP